MVEESSEEFLARRHYPSGGVQWRIVTGVPIRTAWYSSSTSARFIARGRMGPGAGRLAVGLVGVEVFSVQAHQIPVSLDHQQVLGVLGLRLVGEVEAARNQGFAVDVHHLVMSNCVSSIEIYRNPAFSYQSDLYASLMDLPLINDRLDLHATRVTHSLRSVNICADGVEKWGGPGLA